MRKLGLMLMMFILLLPNVVGAQDEDTEVTFDDPEGCRRVVGNPDFVVLLCSNSALTYFAVLNSNGLEIGTTPAGWRFDSHGRFQIDVVTQTIGSEDWRVELWNEGEGTYVAYLFRNNALFGSGSFSGEGALIGTGNFVGNTNTTSTQGNVQVDVIVTVNGATTTTSTTTAVRSGVRANGSFDEATRTYTVADGDTLYGISVRFSVGLLELARLNNINDVSFIQIGQRLTIP